MAGFTSTERRYGEYIKPFNLDLIAKALSYKDGKYVEGYEEIQSGINEIASLDIMKAEDKGYLLTRLSSLVEGTNNAGTLELGEQGFVKNLDAQISQSVDENVVNAYQSTRQIRAFQSHIKEISEKDGGKAYSTLNEAYAMQPINQYMSSGKVGEKISNYGALQYTPFKDVEGELQERIEDFKGKIKDGFIERPNPNDPRQMIREDVRGMNDIQIRNLVAGMMGTSYDEQNRINAWGRYQGYNQNGLSNLNRDVDSYITKVASDIDNQLLLLETQKASVKDKGLDISAINGEISSLSSQREQLLKSKDNILKNPLMAGGLLEREGVISRASAYAIPMLGRIPDSVVGKNEVYYADIANQFKEAELDLQREKLQLDVQELELKKLGKLNADGTSKDGNSTSTGMTKDSGMSYIPGIATPNPDVDPKLEITNAMMGMKSEVDSMTKQANDYVYRMAAQGHAGAKAFIADYEKQTGGKANGHLFRQLYTQKATDLGLNIVTDPNGNQLFKKSDLTAKSQEFVSNKQVFDKINQKYEGSNFNSTVNSQQYVDSIVKDGRIFLATPNGLVNAKEMLQKRGIVDGNGRKIKNVTDDAYVKNTLLANEMLSRVNNSPFTSQNFKGNLADIFSSEKTNTMVQFDRNDVVELSRIYGERLDTIVDAEGGVTKGQLQKVAPKIFNALKTFNSGYLTPQAGRVTYSSDVRKSFRTGINDEMKIARNAEYNSLLGGIKVPGRVVITDMKSNAAQTIVRNIIGFTNAEGSAKNILETATPDDYSSIAFNVANEKGEMIMDVVVKNGKENEKVSVKIDTESMMRNAPELMNQINFQQKSQAFSQPILGTKPIQSSSDGVGYLNPGSNFIYTQQVAQNVMKEYSGLPGYEALARGLRKDDAQNYLSEKVRFAPNASSKHFYNDILSAPLSQQEKLTMIKEREAQLINGVQALVNNSNKFVISASFINKDSYAVELKDRKTGQSVYQSAHAGDNLQSFHSLLDDYESAAYTMILSQVLDSEIQSRVSGNKGSTTQFKNLFGL